MTRTANHHLAGIRHSVAPQHSWLARFLLHPHVPDLRGLITVLTRLAIDAGEIAAGVAALVVALMLVRVLVRRAAGAGSVYLLRLPDEFDRGRLAQLLRTVSLGGDLFGRRSVGFELEVRGRSLTPLVVCSPGVSEAQVAGLAAEAMPGAQLVPIEGWVPPLLGRRRSRVLALRPLTPEQQPLQTRFSADPAGALIRRLADAGASGGGAVVQLLFAPAPTRARTTLRRNAARRLSGKPRRSLASGAFELFAAAVLEVGRGIVELFSSGPPARQHTPATMPSNQTFPDRGLSAPWGSEGALRGRGR